MTEDSKREAPKEKKLLKLERKQMVKNRVIVLLGMKGMKKFKKEECCYGNKCCKGMGKVKTGDSPVDAGTEDFDAVGRFQGCAGAFIRGGTGRERLAGS